MDCRRRGGIHGRLNPLTFIYIWISECPLQYGLQNRRRLMADPDIAGTGNRLPNNSIGFLWTIVNGLRRFPGLPCRDARHRTARSAGESQPDAGRTVLSGERRSSYISQLENNRKSPTVAMLVLLCKALDVRPSEVLAEVERRQEAEGEGSSPPS